MPTTSADAPLAVSMSLNAHNAQGSVCDWVYSRTLERFPALKLAYAESQVGWMPFQYERMDGVWHESVGEVDLPNPPSTYVRGRVFGCIFDDLHGLRSREEVGMEHILFECDFPHSNGSCPGLAPPGLGALLQGRPRRRRGVPTRPRQCDRRVRPGTLRHHRVTRAEATVGTMRPDTWTRDGESGLMARLVALQLVAGQQLESVTAGHGLALGDYLVLGVIRRAPDGVCAPSAVCEVLRRASGGMTLTLDRLESAGWLTRSPDASDRRRVLLRLTPTGEALTIAVNEDLHAWERSIATRRRLGPLVSSIDDLLDLLEPETTS